MLEHTVGNDAALLTQVLHGSAEGETVFQWTIALTTRLRADARNA